VFHSESQASAFIRARKRCVLISCAAALTYLIGAWAPTLAQDATKQATEKWRPKDGLYDFDNGTAFAVPYDNLPLHYIELSKRLIAACSGQAAKDFQVGTLAGSYPGPMNQH
jgi:hypothetical protein